MRVRTARPTNSLAPLRRFYVEGAGLAERSAFADHDGFSGLILAAVDWELEFVVVAGVTAPRATPHNPWWAEHGVTFEDPDGYHLVLARES